MEGVTFYIFEKKSAAVTGPRAGIPSNRVRTTALVSFPLHRLRTRAASAAESTSLSNWTSIDRRLTTAPFFHAWSHA
jgi:hypothetical protein